MSGELIYIELAEAIEIHRIFMVRTSKQSQGLRSSAELDSALARPRMAAYYEVSQNQPFVDGNKRTAIVLADVFLRVNGLRYDGEPIHFAHQLEAVAERTDSLDAATDRFEAWLRENTVPISQPDGP
jgi:death-on-curing protein